MGGLGLRVTVEGRTFDVPPDDHADIGRSDVCTIQITDRRISACHAVVWPTTEGWRFADRGTPRGSWADGMRVDDQLLAGPTVLWLGDAEDGIPGGSRVPDMPGAEDHSAWMTNTPATSKVAAAYEYIPGQPTNIPP